MALEVEGVGKQGGLEYSAAGLILYYNLICGPRGFSYPPHLIPHARALTDRRIDKLMFIIGPGSGKALHPDTPVLCKTGWKPIRDVNIGEQMYCPDGGTFSRVRAVTWQPPEPLWRVRFADGREVLAHGQHEWLAHHKKMGHGVDSSGGLRWQLCTTEQIALKLNCYEALYWYVPLTEPVHFPKAELPISPYVLGVCLGDGAISSTGFVRVTNPDQEIFDEVKQELMGTDFELSRTQSNSSGCPVWSILKSGPVFTRLGLRDKRSWEKWIPFEYKFASAEQRLALLQGLMDTDGTCGVGGGANFSSTSFQLAQDVQELVWSLGGIAKLVERQTYFTSNGIRKPGRKSWRVSIRFRGQDNLFRLPRQRLKAGYGQYSDTLKLRIVSIEREQNPEPSVCVSLSSPDGLFLADNYIVTHNSTLLSQVYPSFEIGHDPTKTLLGISAGELLMQGFQKSIMETIEWNPHFHRLFPKVRPDKAGGWSSERGLFVTGRELANPDANFAACGLDSKSLTGKHGRDIICDDLHDKDNSANLEAIDKVWNTWFNTVQGRGDPRGARFIVAGRRYHQEDLYGRLMRTGEFVILTIPAERERTRDLWVDVQVPDGLVCCFTEEDVPRSRPRRLRLRLPE